MKPLLLLGCCCLLTPGAFAQHRGGGAVGGGHAGGGRAGHYSARGRASIQSFRRGGYGGFYGGDYPWFYDDGSGLPADAGPSNVTMLYPSPPPPPPPPVTVTQPAHPMIHEYIQQDAQGILPERDTQQSLYVIALRDKTVETAMTYWVDNDTLYYLDANRQEKRAPLSSVDRDLSVRLNREHQMPFDIP